MHVKNLAANPERRQWSRSGVFIEHFEQISHIVLVFSLLTLNKYMPHGEVWLSLRYTSVFCTEWGISNVRIQQFKVWSLPTYRRILKLMQKYSENKIFTAGLKSKLWTATEYKNKSSNWISKLNIKTVAKVLGDIW